MNWYIHVTGYGGFDFEGPEDEALEMRAHKARWEGGIGYLWRVADDGKITCAWPAHDRPGCWEYPPTCDPFHDEELLAEAIARWHEGDAGDRENPEYLLDEPGGPWWVDPDTVQYAYAQGLLEVISPLPGAEPERPELSPAGYAVGAALGMALEGRTLAEADPEWLPRFPSPFRRPPPRFVLTRVQGASGAAEDRVLCATLSDVCAAMRVWFPEMEHEDSLSTSMTTTAVEFWDREDEFHLLASMSEVFE